MGRTQAVVAVGVALLALTAAARPARAQPLVPPELAGLVDDTSGLRAVRLLSTALRMGEGGLIIWEEDRDSGDDGRKLTGSQRVQRDLSTHLMVASADNRAVLLRLTLATTTRVRTRRGVAETRMRARADFADRSADGVPELVITRVAGDAPRERVYQARLGGLHVVHAGVLACPRSQAAAAPLTVSAGAEATPAVIAATDRALGAALDAELAVLRCALWDALLAHGAALPPREARVWVQPPPEGFRADAPARRGPARAVIWLERARSALLARAIWRGGEVELDQVQAAHPEGAAAGLAWLDAAPVGDRLVALVEATPRRGKRAAVLVDVVDDHVLLTRPLSAGTPAVLADADKDGAIDLIIGGRGRSRRGAAIFRRDPATGDWSPTS